MFLKNQISILKHKFLKDRVTPKTGGMMLNILKKQLLKILIKPHGPHTFEF